MNLRDVFSWSRPCGDVRASLSAYADDRLPTGERKTVAVHLRECRLCALRFDELQRTRGMVRSLHGAKTPPADLAARLKVMAVREAAGRRDAVRKESAIAFAWSGLQQRVRNSMQPLALPFAGGLVSAMVLFSMLLPTFPVVARTTPHDVPLGFYQEPTVVSVAPFGFANDEIIVEVTLDDQGQVIDCRLPDTASAEMRREIENTLLFSRFTPALAFGQPTTARLRLTFRRSHIDVKG
ncbi:MAG: zf-HC2 domain-containing protein [Bryobacterales bacterium]|nr:zf-HC2 domain-containing protein [Bryobacterales bacterium]